jgi:hypothetical protein
MNIALVIFGVLGIVLQFITRKQQEEEKSILIVLMQYLTMLSIVVIGFYSQINASKKDKEYKQAVYQIDIVSKISESFNAVLQDNAKLQNNIIIIKNYLSFEKAKKENPKFKDFIDWSKVANPNQISKLNESKKALENLKSIAINIVQLNLEHPNIIPYEILEWSNITLKIDFNDVEKYFDPYSPIGEPPKQTVLQYQKKLGKAFGSAMGTIRRCSTVLTSP